MMNNKILHFIGFFLLHLMQDLLYLCLLWVLISDVQTDLLKFKWQINLEAFMIFPYPHPHFCVCIHEIFSRIKIINLSKITCVELAATLLECPLKNTLSI